MVRRKVPRDPESIPHEAWYFLYGLVGVLAILITGWIIKMH